MQSIITLAAIATVPQTVTLKISRQPLRYQCMYEQEIDFKTDRLLCRKEGIWCNSDLRSDKTTSYGTPLWSKRSSLKTAADDEIIDFRMLDTDDGTSHFKAGDDTGIRKWHSVWQVNKTGFSVSLIELTEFIQTIAGIRSNDRTNHAIQRRGYIIGLLWWTSSAYIRHK